MYQTEIKGDRLYHAQSSGYGQPVETFGQTQDGETPMSLVNIALASCVTMCIQGYFAKHHQLTELPITVESHYENKKFTLLLRMDDALTEEMKSALLTYIDDNCRFKQLLRQDLDYQISFAEKKEP